MMEERQTGLTTKQMLTAPKESIYVWVNHHFNYPKSLAKSLGRSDLQIVSPSWLTGQNARGRKITEITLDHATRLTPNQNICLSDLRTSAMSSSEPEPREEWMVKPPDEILEMLVTWMRYTQSGTAMFDGKVTKGVTIFELMEKMNPELAVLINGWGKMR